MITEHLEAARGIAPEAAFDFMQCVGADAHAQDKDEWNLHRDRVLHALPREAVTGQKPLLRQAANKAYADARRKTGLDKGGEGDLGDALALADALREDVRVVKGRTWHWQETHWQVDQRDEEITAAVQEYMHSFDKDRANTRTRSSILALTKTELRASVEFNAGTGDHVNCANGTLRLADGEWRLDAHEREDYLTACAPWVWSPEAQAPRFEAFLEEIFAPRDGDGEPWPQKHLGDGTAPFDLDADAADKRTCLLEMMGYALMPHARHKKVVLLVGAGDTGKSVVLRVLEGLVGEGMFSSVAPDDFTRSFQLAQLEGKLLNTVAELTQGAKLPDQQLKAVSAGDAMQVEHKGQDPFVMKPHALCVIATNHMPYCRDFSGAMLNRLVFLLFNRVFTKVEQDEGLGEALLNELPGIARLALAAYAAAVARRRFAEPASMKAAKEQWRLDVDPVARFADECLVPDPSAEIKSADLYAEFQAWARDHGMKEQKMLSGLAFGRRICALGGAARRGTAGRRITQGFAFAETDAGTPAALTDRQAKILANGLKLSVVEGGGEKPRRRRNQEPPAE